MGRLSRSSGRGGGTTLPGRVLLRLDRRAIERLGSRIEGPVTLLSATNGKTTTAGILASMIRASGSTLVHNRAGSNMSWGVATALLEQQGEQGLFEVDEAWLASVAHRLDPDVLILSNLFRDQLDRYGELETIADSWAGIADALGGRAHLALAADDPLVADLGRDARGESRPGVSYFGIEDPSVALDAMPHAFDAKHCRRCGAPYRYARAFVGHLGHYECTGCGVARPRPQVAAREVELRGFEGSTVTIETPLGPVTLELAMPGLYNVYNALAATAGGLALGLGLEAIATGASEATGAFGRVESIAIRGHRAWLLLVKNPIGMNEVVRTLEQESGRLDARLDVWLALNDGIADGRDISWIWDADLERLAEVGAGFTCAGTRGAEMAVRLKYAGADPERILVDQRPLADSLAACADSARGDVFALPTYTALIDLRSELARRGLVAEYWR